MRHPARVAARRCPRALAAAAAVAAAAGAAAAGCPTSYRGAGDVPFVQPSSDAPPDFTVTIQSDLTYAHPCVTIDPGETIEWSNTSAVPVNVTSLPDPQTGEVALYSPNLVGPAPIPGSEWRYTFETPGRFDYYDTNSGTGRTVRDPYYNTIIVVGVPENATRGTVCVRGDPTLDCDALCCTLTGGAWSCPLPTFCPGEGGFFCQ